MRAYHCTEKSDAMKPGIGLIPLIRPKQKENESGLPGAREDNDNCENGHDNNTYDDESTGLKEGSLIRLGGASLSKFPVVIGRRQLLTSFRAACNKEDFAGANRHTSPHCKTFQWAAKALSREMLRFSDVGMQIRGKHAVVLVNSHKILSNAQANDVQTIQNQNNKDSQKVEWSANPVSIVPGDVLSFEPCVGQNLFSRLEFGVVSLDHRLEIEKVSTITEKNVIIIQCPNGSIMDKVDFTKHAEEGKEDRNFVKNPSSQVILDGNSKILEVNETNNSPQKNCTKLAKSSFLVHFFPFGNGFSASRRQKLEQNLKVLGATIVEDIWKAKYIVISESIRSLAIVAKRMHISEKLLARHFENNVDIRCVLPSWADYCITTIKCLVIPSRIHAWYYSPSCTTIPNILSRNTVVKRDRNEFDNDNEKKMVEEEPRPMKKVTNGNDTIQMRRQCFRRNVRVAEAFKNLASLHQSMSLLPADTWKSYSFQIVAGRLLELDFEINNDEETLKRLRSIKGFGNSVCEKIQECIEHGTISRIQEFQSDPHRQAMMNLKNIWGVGTVKASDLIDRGYRTIEDVRIGIRQNRLVLERNQLVGVDCYEDILDRMTRSEVEKIGKTVQLVAERMFPGIETSIMGSYRRGKDQCGDVDIQLTHPAYVESIPVEALGRIIDTLWNEGKIAMHLTFLVGMTTGSHYTDYQKASQHLPGYVWERTKTISKQTEFKFYMGCVYSPTKPRVRRRVDIKFYPYRERAFATLYFTGNGYFNRSMRLWASRVFNFKLNDHGLFDSDGKSRVFEASSEREIFVRLKLIYREPCERHYWDALEPCNKAMNCDLKLSHSELKEDVKNQWVK